MEKEYTAAFLSTTVSGEIFIINQFQGTRKECRDWVAENQNRYEQQFSEVSTIVMRRRSTTLPKQYKIN